jgi:hypothetical protein
MKRIFLILVVITFISLVGCEKETQTPFEPATGQAGEFSIASNSNEEVQYIAIYSVDGELQPYDEKEFIPLNPGREHFLTFIQEGIIDGDVTFDTDNYKNAYLNKLDAAIKMVVKGNYNGAIHKIENDLKKKAEEWITGSYPEAVVSFLDIQVYLLENPDVEFDIESALTWTTLSSLVPGPKNPDVSVCVGVGPVSGGASSSGEYSLYLCFGLYYRQPI